MTDTFIVRLSFDENLAFFTKRHAQEVERQLAERTSVKDVIESCGVPHTEVDLILHQGSPLRFEAIMEKDAELRVLAVPAPLYPGERLQSHHHTRFIADGQLGKLARRLRLLGLDVSYKHEADDALLVRLSASQDRVLLTRDRCLLMHRIVRHGYYLRSLNREEQARAVLRRFNLGDSLAPFTRCLNCNFRLQPVLKSEVITQLEPLTKKFYDDFRRCSRCGRVYWKGSHYEKLVAQIDRLRI